MSVKIETVPFATWTIKDIVGVIFFVFTGFTIFYIVLHSFLSNEKTVFTFLHYIGPLLSILVPLFWIKKRYGLSKEALGIRRGNLRFPKIVLVGLVTAVIYYLLIRLTLFGHESIPTGVKFTYVHLILLPVSIGGFPTTVLSPIGEEILDRGFIYGYLRKKLGVVIGLILQAVLFSFSHIALFHKNDFYSILDTFLIGLMLGVLYEKTGSLYPSMICHGAINYLAIIRSAI